MNNFKIKLILIFLVLTGLACGTSIFVPTPTPGPSPTPTWTLLPGQNPETPHPPTATPTPDVPEITATATETVALACPNAPPARVEVGDNARVTFTNGLPLRVRREPAVADDNVVVQIPEGAEMEITGGPSCWVNSENNSGFTFWEIRVRATGQTGWVAEGDFLDYYIEPAE